MGYRSIKVLVIYYWDKFATLQKMRGSLITNSKLLALRESTVLYFKIIKEKTKILTKLLLSVKSLYEYVCILHIVNKYKVYIMYNIVNENICI